MLDLRVREVLLQARTALDNLCGDTAAETDGGCDCADCKRGQTAIEAIDEFLLEDEEGEEDE